MLSSGCYLASGKLSGDASRGEALRPPPCTPHPLFLVGSGEAVDMLSSGCDLASWLGYGHVGEKKFRC